MQYFFLFCDFEIYNLKEVHIYCKLLYWKFVSSSNIFLYLTIAISPSLSRPFSPEWIHSRNPIEMHSICRRKSGNFFKMLSCCLFETCHNKSLIGFDTLTPQDTLCFPWCPRPPPMLCTTKRKYWNMNCKILGHNSTNSGSPRPRRIPPIKFIWGVP